jgi:hypothetical protein
MSPHRQRFTTYRPISPREISAAEKGVFYATGTGDPQVEVPNGVKSTPIILTDKLHVPDIGAMAISVSRIAKPGYSSYFEGK